jgi:hypothetical protein
MPVSETPEIKSSNAGEKPNESENNNVQTNKSLNLGLQDDSASTIYDPRKSLMTDFNDDENSRKGKNVVDKFKHSLPSTVFKKREFVLEKSKTMSAEKGLF